MFYAVYRELPSGLRMDVRTASTRSAAEAHAIERNLTTSDPRCPFGVRKVETSGVPIS